MLRNKSISSVVAATSGDVVREIAMQWRVLQVMAHKSSSHAGAYRKFLVYNVRCFDESCQSVDAQCQQMFHPM